MIATSPSAARDEVDRWIRALAAIERPSASQGELEAARWVADELTAAGADPRLEVEPAHGTHLPFVLPSLLALIGGFLRSRLVGSALALLGTATIVDELEGRRRVLRRLLRRRETYNVVGRLGGSSARQTVVFVAHHDVARPWGAAIGALVSAPPPPLLGGKPLPLADALVYAPMIVFAGVATGSRTLKRIGIGLCAFIVGLLGDIARRRPVPGANDNASGVAALLGVARDVSASAPASLQVLLLSTGSEETMLEGMDAFLHSHRHDLDPERTLVVVLDQIGWERLVLRDSEGVLRRYRSDRADLDRLLSAARSTGVALSVEPPFPAPSDGLAARWAGLPTVFVGSVAANGGYPHYHRPSDLPEHVNLDTVAAARKVCVRLVEQLSSA
jgi:peptidase M28-like protein